MRMKEANYRDKAIAKQFIEHGQVASNSKLVAAQWSKLRKTLTEHTDKLLESGFAAWHAGDDVVLNQAIANADRDVANDIEKAKAKKWQHVADHMKKLKPATNFGPKACQDRAHSLLDGNIKPFPESLENADHKTLAQIQARREKESRIEDDRALRPSLVDIKREEEKAPDGSMSCS
jgi:hypothetical protein